MFLFGREAYLWQILLSPVQAWSIKTLISLVEKNSLSFDVVPQSKADPPFIDLRSQPLAVSWKICRNRSCFKCFDLLWRPPRCLLQMLLQMFKCSNVQMFKYSNVQMFKCSNVQMFKCSNVDLVWRPPDPGLPASNAAAAVYSLSDQSKAARRRFKGKPTLLHVIGRLNCKIINPPSKTRPDSKVIVFLLLLQCLKRTIWIPVCALL